MTTPPTTPPVPPSPCPFVSRGGLKLAHALDTFAFNPAGLRCADFGCNIGGFTDCLLQRSASHVFALDTGYGTLAWKLRIDPRITVRERTNALHAPTPPPDQLVDLVVIDMAWTPQRLCIPAALKWLRPLPTSRIITLIKPHYELRADEKDLLVEGVLADAESQRTTERVLAEMPSLSVDVLASTRSPIVGGAGKGKGMAAGNSEWLALLSPALIIRL